MRRVEGDARPLSTLALRAQGAAGRAESWRAGGGGPGFGEAAPAGVAEPYALELAGDTERAAGAGMRSAARTRRRWRSPTGATRSRCAARSQALQRLGARPAAAIVARRLRERGVRDLPRGRAPATRKNPAGLTARELEVARRSCARAFERRDRHRLFLSVRTVDHHVSAILPSSASAAAARPSGRGRSGSGSQAQTGRPRAQNRRFSRCRAGRAGLGSSSTYAARTIGRTGHAALPRRAHVRRRSRRPRPPAEGAEQCLEVVSPQRSDEGVTWVQSYVSDDSPPELLRLRRA